MITFLKKLGSVLAQGLAVVTGVWPLVAPLFGSGTAKAQVATTVVNDFTSIASLVITIETALQGQPGAAKLAALVPLVSNVIKTSEAVSGHKIANEDLFTKGCTEVAQGAVDILNALDAGTVKSTGTPTTTTTPTNPPLPNP